MDWKDTLIDPLAAVIGINVSLGIGQVRMSTAKKVEDAGLKPKLEASEQYYRVTYDGNVIIYSGEDIARSNALSDDVTNIEYVAAYLKYIQDIWKPIYPQIDGKSDILGTLYNIGEGNPNQNPAPNDFGLEVKSNYYKMQNLLELC